MLLTKMKKDYVHSVDKYGARLTKRNEMWTGMVRWSQMGQLKNQQLCYQNDYDDLMELVLFGKR